MNIVVVENRDAAGDLVAGEISDRITQRPRFVLGVATGDSPQPVYRNLARRVARGLDLSQLNCFALDEYLDLVPGHPQRYAEVLRRDLVLPLGLRTDQLHVPCDAGKFEAQIAAAGGIDMQLLGIGRNGHLGFNEPGSALDGRTHITDLAAETRQDNARFFANPAEVPRRCITQGLGTILRARRLVLLAFGESKAASVAAAVLGPVSSVVPASVLQRHHSVLLCVDRAAAGGLRAAGHAH